MPQHTGQHVRHAPYAGRTTDPSGQLCFPPKGGLGRPLPFFFLTGHGGQVMARPGPFAPLVGARFSCLCLDVDKRLRVVFFPSGNDWNVLMPCAPATCLFILFCVLLSHHKIFPLGDYSMGCMIFRL